MSKQTYLTGITTSGTPHLGNYVGAIRPAIEASRDPANSNYYFLADYHALIKSQDPAMLGQSWLLTCMTAKGLMNRAHAYKAVVQENTDAGSSDPDKGINMGLFSYPILMAADILMFKATKVPVGKDQIQHLEMARDIAQRFNHHYGEHLVIPEVVVEERAAVLSGLDGRKMSKSYGNTIPLFETAKKLRKSIMKIKTNSQEPGEPKDPEGNTVFEIYQAFATPAQTDTLRQAYADGIGWGDAKQQLFELVDAELAEPRERYNALIADPAAIDKILLQGAEKARVHSKALMNDLRKAVGIS